MESLNQDVLLEIFDYLDGKSLKSSALVCKQWDQIIGTSSATMKKLPLIIRDDWEAKFDEINSLRRKFHTIILDSIFTTNKKLAKIFKNLAAHTRQFEMNSVTVTHPSFTDILSSMGLLENLIVHDFYIEQPAMVKMKESKLKSLKKLVFSNSDWSLFKFLTKSKTQIHTIKIASNVYEEEIKKVFEKFLSKQEKLEVLAVRVSQGDFYNSLKAIEEQNYKFKLKRLAVDFRFWGDDPNVDQSFIDFLQHHRETLEELETEHVLSEKIIEFIMKTMKIKRLIINATRLPTTPLFYNALRPNLNLKTLVVDGELDKFDVARGLLHIYPSIEKLVIKSWHQDIVNDVLVYIAHNLKHLKVLEIPTLTADTPEIPIPSLKTFHVDFVDDVTNWQTFLMNNSSLEIVTVQWCTNSNSFSYEILNAITLRLQKLKQVKFGAYFSPTKRIVEMMGRNCSELQLLEVFDDRNEEQRENLNFSVGKVKVIFYPHEAVTSVFKTEPTLLNEDELDSIEDSDEDDEEMDMMDVDSDNSWDDDDDGDIDGDYDDDGILWFFG